MKDPNGQPKEGPGVIPALLSGGLGAGIMEAWQPFSAHSGQCSLCEPIAEALKGVPDDPFPYYEQCCPGGQALFIVWADAKIALTAHLHEVSAPWGMAGLVGDEAEERSAAITAMPGPAAADLFREPDQERREATIRALIAAHRAGGVVTHREREEERRQCAAEDCQTGPYGTHGSFVVSPKYPRRRYCCELCRKRDQRRQRPRIESTED